jgi:copper chaperone
MMERAAAGRFSTLPIQPRSKRSPTMTTFRVADMTCGHCVGSITRAVQEADAGARVDVDLHQHRVTISQATATPQALAHAIREAGYTPEVVGEPAPGAA